MTEQANDLIEMAEALPIDERAAIVDRLLLSMYAHELEIDEAWKVEAERRVEEIRSGRLMTIPGDQVFAEIEERFGK